jgi:hypothetical protein
MHSGFQCQSLKERGCLKDLAIDGRMISQILIKPGGRMWTGFTGFCEHSNKSLSSVKCAEILA